MRAMCFTLIMSVFVAACAVRLPQLDSFIGNDAAEMDLSPYYWTFSADGERYELLAISLPNKTMFADKESRFVSFDGWMINEVAGFSGNNSSISISQADNSFSVLTNGQAIANYTCDAWVKNSHRQGAQFVQSCSHGYESTIDIDADGNITRIHQFDGLHEWVLEKNNI